jgi:hypothetical protein
MSVSFPGQDEVKFGHDAQTDAEERKEVRIRVNETRWKRELSKLERKDRGLLKLERKDRESLREKAKEAKIKKIENEMAENRNKFESILKS